MIKIDQFWILKLKSKMSEIKIRYLGIMAHRRWQKLIKGFKVRTMGIMQSVITEQNKMEK